MSSMVSYGAKIIEKFFCHCGKETKPVKIIRTKGAGGIGGMCWQCEDGHIERDWSTRQRKAKS